MYTSRAPSNFDRVCEFQKIRGAQIVDTPNPDYLHDAQARGISHAQLDEIGKQVGSARVAISAGDIGSLLDKYLAIMHTAYALGALAGIDMDAAFAAYNESMISGVCQNEREAQETIDSYKKREGGGDVLRVRETGSGQFVVLNDSQGGRLVKSVNYRPFNPQPFIDHNAARLRVPSTSVREKSPGPPRSLRDSGGRSSSPLRTLQLATKEPTWRPKRLSLPIMPAIDPGYSPRVSGRLAAGAPDITPPHTPTSARSDSGLNLTARGTPRHTPSFDPVPEVAVLPASPPVSARTDNSASVAQSASVAPVPIGGDWYQCVASNGMVYFHNNRTKVSQWHKPASNDPVPAANGSVSHRERLNNSTGATLPMPIRHSSADNLHRRVIPPPPRR